MARQRTFFHKCHRCIYRGQAADWEPEAAPLAMINVHAAEEPAHADVKEVPLTRPAPTPKPAAAKTKTKTKAKAKAAAAMLATAPAPTPVAATSPVG